MSKNVNIQIGGIFLPLLAILFIALKLTDYIDWSWLWVLSPIWLPIAIVALCFSIIGLLFLFLKMLEKK